MGGSSGTGKTPKATKPPDLDGLRITLKYIQHDSKPCECLQNALMRLPQLKKVAVTPTEATMLFTGDWDQMVLVTNAASSVRIKSALVTPGLFSIEYVAEKTTSVKVVDVLAKVPGVEKVFGDSGKAWVFGAVGNVNPKSFAPALKEGGFKFIALRSHRLRTLSYEAWDKGFRPEKIRDRLMKVPGVLRADVDPKEGTVTVLLIRDSVKDLELVSAAEDVNCTLFPGIAEDDEPMPENPPTPTK